MLKKLRRRFTFINMTIVAAMLLIIFGLIFHFTKTDLDTKSQQTLHALSQNSAEDIQLPYFTLKINAWGNVIASGNTHYDITDGEFVEELIHLVYQTGTVSGSIEKYDLIYTVTQSFTTQQITFVDISPNKAAVPPWMT